MKKRTKSRSRDSLAAAFWLVIFICLFGAGIHSVLFYNSFFRSLTKMNEAPIATITFKHKTAQRKFSDRVVWDRLRQGSPVYDGDTIHTAAQAAATIWFSDGNVMELSENTMAQVFLAEGDALRAELSGGTAYIDSSGSEGGMSFSSSGVEVSVSSGTALSASSAARDGGFAMQIYEGSASVAQSGAADGEAVSVGAGDAVSVAGGTMARPAIIVTKPAPNERILYHTEGSHAVRFDWSAEESPPGDGRVVFETAQDKEFTQGVSRRTVTELSSLVEEMDPGVHYWKFQTVHDGEGGAERDESVSGKLTLIQSLPPTLMTPADGYVFYYRTRPPAVRLTWTESASASSYRLVVADNPELRDPAVDVRQGAASAIVPTLGEGRWWWRVTPFYTLNKIGLSAPSEVGSFRIERRDELLPATLLVPQDGATVNTDESGKALAFSWKAEPEAVSYTLLVADNPELRGAVLDKRTQDNYLTLDQQEMRKLRDGKYWWAVVYRDDEENAAPLSAVRAFFAYKGDLEQHVVEPQDGYRVAQNLLADTKFTWKGNLPAEFTSRLQVALDAEFLQPVSDQPVGGSAFKGMNLETGDYFWRLKSESPDGGVEFVSPARLLRVMENLDEAALARPIGRAVAQESIPYEFRWNPVRGADYYKFSIYSASDNELVYEDTIAGTDARVDMFSGPGFVDKAAYRWELQAHALEIPGVSSRLAGKLAESSFVLFKLRPVEIVAPARDAEISGLDAILNPIVARWRAVDDLTRAQLVLRRTDVTPPETVLKVPSDAEFSGGDRIAPNSVTLDTPDGLRPGSYEIVVYAETVEGIDISNVQEKYIGRFTISPVPPLDAPDDLRVEPKAFDVAYLQNRANPRVLRFDWSSVSDATDYFVSIYGDDGSRLLRENVASGNSFALDFTEMTADAREVFSDGRFTARVEAVRRIDTNNDGVVDKILQEGVPADVEFETHIPTPEKATAKGAAKPYGKQ